MFEFSDLNRSEFTKRTLDYRFFHFLLFLSNLSKAKHKLILYNFLAIIIVILIISLRNKMKTVEKPITTHK